MKYCKLHNQDGHCAKCDAESKASLSGVDGIRADRDLEKKRRKDAEHALCEAAELLEEIMRGKVNPEAEAKNWLRAHDPIRLNDERTSRPND
jgi:hypothetical protein